MLIDGIHKEKILARNAYYNILGTSLPLLVAIYAIPRLIKGLGVERFGILSLVWIAVGYFSLFDFGISKALTKVLAERLHKNNNAEMRSIFWTAQSITLLFCIVAIILTYSFTNFLVYNLLEIPTYLQQETIKAFRILTLSIPIITSISLLRSVLEVYQKFHVINAIRTPFMILNMLIPVWILSYTVSIFDITFLLVLLRFISILIYCYICMKLIPWFQFSITINRSSIKPLFSFGAWMTISSIIGPILLYIDKLVLATQLPISYMTYYTTPYELVTKILIIPSSIIAVLFPAFSYTFKNKRQHCKKLYIKTLKANFVIIFPLTLIVIFFAKVGLSIWIDDNFAQLSYRVAQLLAIGVLLNSFGLISQALIRAAGYPNITAKLHIFELPLYLCYLYFLVENFGTMGAALAWVIRVSLSAMILSVLAKRTLSIQIT